MEKIKKLPTISIKQYNNLKYLYQILNSWKIKWEEFLVRTEEFLKIYEEHKEIKEFKLFYIDLKNAYLDKQKSLEKKFEYSKKIFLILNNKPANNINYSPKIKEEN